MIAEAFGSEILTASGFSVLLMTPATSQNTLLIRTVLTINATW